VALHWQIVPLKDTCQHRKRMIIGVGTDLAEVLRIRESIARYGDRFLNRIYTAGERAYAGSKANAAERFAARFAAKEAGMKAIGTGWNFGVTWKDFEVVNERSGRPKLLLHGVAAQVAERLGAGQITISLTHTSQIAFAVVILERKSLDMKP
jgi:holo-[acyl-carrier protein] synthase